MSSIGRSSALLASGTIVSRVLGFVKAVVIASAVGGAVSASGDAYAVSTIVPSSIYAIIGGGLLSAILVPQIVRASAAPDGGNAYVNKLVTLGLTGFAVVATAATLAAPLLVRLFARSQLDLQLATAFAFWSLPQIFFLGMYALLGEVLNARKAFGPFTWAPVANNVVGIAAIVTFVALFGGRDRPFEDWSPGMIALFAGGGRSASRCRPCCSSPSGAGSGCASAPTSPGGVWDWVTRAGRPDGPSACSSPARSPAFSRRTSPPSRAARGRVRSRSATPG
ncbi:hypothetical protein GCM10025866_12700 [Naasia aerilata]|uniref:Integral membrane protein MviN n=1 Tax=Naasia aerilata TaxID=1162966 RepID=A0ABN6XNW3_9MICO|nr:hypothetical protein GCM10025866_12700 [Naasia aerilata]